MFKQIITGAALLLVGGTALAARWQVEITNMTPGQTFTPILATTHYGQVSLFEIGEPASDELATLAESGDTAPLTALLESLGGRVGDVKTSEGLLAPGMSTKLTVRGRPGQRLSLAAMLIPTNDTFVAVDGVFLPLRRGTTTVRALAYDAGSEANDQNCANIPGPRCMGAAMSAPAETDEGFVVVSNGFHELGTGETDAGEVLGPAVYDWRNPVAIVTIRRVH